MKHVLWIGVLLASVTATAGDPDAILGRWLTADGKSTIEIYQCGEAYCGRIEELLEKVYPPDDEMAGQTRVDRENPDPEQQDRPILGLKLMQGFKFKREGLWSGGTIYDPEDGKTYKCKITFEGEQLKVRGYVGVPALGRTERWTRADSD